jgi:siderophore synthetase component
MGFDIAPYGQAIASVSDLVGGVLKRLWPEKMSEFDAAKFKQEMALALMQDQGQQVVQEFADRADARALAKADVEKGNWFTNVLSATVRPVFGYAAMTAFGIPLGIRYGAALMGHALDAALIEQLTPNQIEKEIILTVIYFFFGGRTVEKGIALWKGAK